MTLFLELLALAGLILLNAFFVAAEYGLVTSRREGRSIIYTAAYGRMSELLAFLIEDCCAGDGGICAPLVAITERAVACCAPVLKEQPE